jgi:hypothetical protein
MRAKTERGCISMSNNELDLTESEDLEIRELFFQAIKKAFERREAQYKLVLEYLQGLLNMMVIQENKDLANKAAARKLIKELFPDTKLDLMIDELQEMLKFRER